MKSLSYWIVTIAVLSLVVGCEQESTMPEASQQPAVEPQSETMESAAPGASMPVQEAISFGGKPLYRNPVDAEKLAELDQLIAAVEMKANLSEDDYIELGRHYISGNRFQDAIALYTRGLEAHPDSFKLRRHRGHRYINVRELDKAIVDLNEAVELMGDTSADVMEYDGSGKPYGTYEHWVWYHVGLYHYLNEDFDEAARAYEKCAATAMDNKGLIGASDWLYNAYQKGGNPAEAARVIDAIPADIDADRNHPYFHRVMVYKGITSPADLLDVNKPANDWGGRDITLGYGIANWYKFNGDADTADKIYKAILQTPFWNCWAYVVTDKEQAT